MFWICPPECRFISNYLTGTNYSGLKPKGHAQRMERYGSSTTYSSTGTNVNEERNKTELHGNPLKSR